MGLSNREILLPLQHRLVFSLELVRLLDDRAPPPPDELHPHPPSVQGPDGLVWAGQRWPEAEIQILLIHNRKRFGSTETSLAKPLRFNRNRFG